MRHTVVILGARGFIGSQLCELYPDAIQITRENMDIEFRDAIVFNCISGKNQNSLEDSMLANYEIPKNFLKVHKKGIFLWIQLGSYYSDYKIMHGEDFNAYSLAKDKFSSFLFESDLDFVELILPHIYSSHENSSRIISRIINSSFGTGNLLLRSAKQEIPILSISNLMKTLSYDQIINYSRKSKFKVKAELILEISNFINLLEKATGNTFQVTIENNSEARFFRKIHWETIFSDHVAIKNRLTEIIEEYTSVRLTEKEGMD